MNSGTGGEASAAAVIVVMTAAAAAVGWGEAQHGKRFASGRWVLFASATVASSAAYFLPAMAYVGGYSRPTTARPPTTPPQDCTRRTARSRHDAKTIRTNQSGGSGRCAAPDTGPAGARLGAGSGRRLFRRRCPRAGGRRQCARGGVGDRPTRIRAKPSR